MQKYIFATHNNVVQLNRYDPHHDQLPGKNNKMLQVAYTLASILAHFSFYGRRPIENGSQPWKLISDQKYSTTIVITSRKLKSLN